VDNNNVNFSEETEEVEITIEELDAYRESCKQVLNTAKLAQKLSQNEEFQKVIMEDYFVHEPHRLGSLLASGKLTPSGFDGAVNDLKSIGHLRMYLSDQIQKGVIAQESLDEAEAAYNATIETESVQ